MCLIPSIGLQVTRIVTRKHILCYTVVFNVIPLTKWISQKIRMVCVVRNKVIYRPFNEWLNNNLGYILAFFFLEIIRLGDTNSLVVEKLFGNFLIILFPTESQQWYARLMLRKCSFESRLNVFFFISFFLYFNLELVWLLVREIDT